MAICIWEQRDVYKRQGMKKYCYTFENRCKEQPDLLLGDEVTKLFLSTKGENEDEVSKELVDFLHYITESNEHGLCLLYTSRCV